MRLDPNAMTTVALLCVIGIVTTAAASIVASPLVSLSIFGVGGVAALGVIVRGLHHALGLRGEKLATSLDDEMRAVLEAPLQAPAALQPAAGEGNPTEDEMKQRLAVGGCPRCQWRLSLASGNWQQRDCELGCGALVLDSERLLTERAGLDLEVVRALVKEQGVKKGVCPSCSASMHEGRLRGVVVDLCLSCGALWLDKGELAVLARDGAFAAAGGAGGA